MEDVKDEAEKHQVAERSAKAWESTKKNGKDGVKAIKNKQKASKKS